MNENSSLLPLDNIYQQSSSSAAVRRNNTSYNNITDLDNEVWSVTPRIRNQWFKKPDSVTNLVIDKALESMEEDNINNKVNNNIPFLMIPEEYDERIDNDKTYYGFAIDKWGIKSFFSNIPGLLIALILNLFLSASFGSAMFPPEWQFPDTVPRAIGVQMFLFSTLICQICLTALSDFPCAVGMMMVENIPFMQVHIVMHIYISLTQHVSVFYIIPYSQYVFAYYHIHSIYAKLLAIFYYTYIHIHIHIYINR